MPESSNHNLRHMSSVGLCYPTFRTPFLLAVSGPNMDFLFSGLSHRQTAHLLVILFFFLQLDYSTVSQVLGLVIGITKFKSFGINYTKL